MARRGIGLLNWLVPNRQQARHVGPWDLSRSLMNWGPGAPLTIGEACQGIQVWGSTGSGKTTGSLAALIRAFLNLGFGGVFFTVKPTDRAMYERYVMEAGRSQDLIVFGPDQKWKFNFLDAELHRTDAAAGVAENICSLLLAVLEVIDRGSGGDGREEAGFWKRMVRQCLKNCIELLMQARGRLTVTDLYRLLISAPLSAEQAVSENWQRTSFCYECLRIVDEKAKSPRQAADYQLAVDFFMTEWSSLSERTRSVVLSSLSSMLDLLQRGAVRELLSSPETNVTPGEVQDGKLILIDMPVLVWGLMGQAVQVIVKYCVQKAQERRNIADNARPVFLASDESHLLYVASDQTFQTTARSSRTITLNASQSISNYLALLNGERAEAEIYSLLGNLQTSIFHQQFDIKTNEYAAQLIGKTLQLFQNCNHTAPPPDVFSSLVGMRNEREASISTGLTEAYEYDVQPTEFTNLAQGGPPDWKVEAIVVRGGKRFQATGKAWMPVYFNQDV